MESSVGFALLLSALAGLSTTLGSILALFFRKPGPRFMALTLGFSGGVMIMISFGKLYPEGIEAIGFVPANLAFFGGMIFMFLIDILVPHDYMADRHFGIRRQAPEAENKSRLMRTGLLVAFGLAAGASKSRWHEEVDRALEESDDRLSRRAARWLSQLRNRTPH